MRLGIVESGHRWPQALMLRAIGLFSRRRAPDVIRVMYYRPGLFGGEFRKHVQACLRRPSEWTPGERELMAAFVSAKNRCRF
ncbi:MAG TPA: hypothetical protein VI356_21275 [Myxococcales bacterium]